MFSIVEKVSPAGQCICLDFILFEVMPKTQVGGDERIFCPFTSKRANEK